MPSPCRIRATKSQPVPVASAKTTSPSRNAASAKSINGRRPMVSDSGPATRRPGTITATATAYSSVWTSAEKPKVVRSRAYSALGTLLPT